MKKLFTLLCAGAVAAGAFAQTPDTPAESYHIYTQPNSYGFFLSPNNKYVTGQDLAGKKGYIWEFASNEEPVYADEQELPDGCTLMQVSSTGVAAGYTATQAITVGLDGKATFLSVPDDVDDPANPIVYTAAAFGITADAKIVCGVISENEVVQNACIWTEDGKYLLLPCPTTEELGFVAGGSRADYISSDGSVIAGGLIDDMGTYPAILWIRQEDGSYKYDYISKKYWAVDMEDLEHPYMGFTIANMNGGLSENGKWLSVTVVKNTEDWDDMFSRMARYNIETGELTVHEFNPDRTDVNITAEASGSGISNDGSIVGILDDGTSRIGIIWRAGSEQAEVLSTLYPELASMDEIANTPVTISGDSRFICGFGERENPEDEGTPEFILYVIDTKYENDGIRDIISGNGADEVVTAVYDLTGKKVATSAAGLQKGLYIMTTNKGRATKNIVR